MSKLRHPNIIKFKEIIKDKKNDYYHIIMEYADDGDLNEKIKTRKTFFQEDIILNYFIQICLGLKYIHEHKIIHRDLKTQNIFITKKKEIKLGDFGIAKNLKKTLDKAHTIIGTPYYFSPELINNEPYDYKTDIWSLGIVLYELCCLKLPFQGNNIAQLSMKILKGSYSPLPNNYSNDIKVLVKKMLNVNKNKRPSIIDILNYRIIKEKIEEFKKPVSEKKFSNINNVVSIMILNNCVHQGYKNTDRYSCDKEIRNSVNNVFDDIYSNFKIEEKAIDTDFNKKFINKKKIIDDKNNNKDNEYSQYDIYVNKKINFKKKGRNLSVEVPNNKKILSLDKNKSILTNNKNTQNKSKNLNIYLKKYPVDRINISNYFDTKRSKANRNEKLNISNETISQSKIISKEKNKNEQKEKKYNKKERRSEIKREIIKKENNKNILLEEFMKNKQEKIKKSAIISQSINDGLWIRNYSIFSSSNNNFENKESKIDFSKRLKKLKNERYEENEEEDDKRLHHQLYDDKNNNNDLNFLTNFDVLETFNFESENINEDINLHKPNQSGTIFNLFDSINKEKDKDKNIFKIDLDFLQNKSVNSDTINNNKNTNKTNLSNKNEKEENHELQMKGSGYNNVHFDNINLSLDLSLFDMKGNKNNENENSTEISEENLSDILRKKIINNLGNKLFNDIFNFLKEKITSDITNYNYNKIISDLTNEFSSKYTSEQLEKAINYYFDIAFLIIKNK